VMVYAWCGKGQSDIIHKMKKCGRLNFAIAMMCAAVLCGCAESDSKTLRMITDATFPPYVFLRDMEIVGVDVEICRAVAQRMGKAFAVETVDFDSLFPVVVSGKADLAATGITVTEGRKKIVDFSIPYMKTGNVVMYKKSNPFKDISQLKGQKIGVQSNTTGELFVLEQLKQDPERSRSPAEACEALKSGRVAFVIVDVDPAKNCVKGEPDLAISDLITREEYAVALRKGRPELMKVVNETIAELKQNGQLTKWIAEFTAEADALKGK